MKDKVLLAGCVILNDMGDVLLIHKNTTDYVRWETPGGKVEIGERPMEAAVRELKEELGINVKIIKELGRNDFDKDGRNIEYIWYLAETPNETPILQDQDEFDDLNFFPWCALLEIKSELSKNTQNLVDAYFSDEINISGANIHRKSVV